MLYNIAMDVLIHVIIALSSVAFTTYAYLSPTTARLRISYGLIGLTLISGTYLVFAHPGNLVQACISGLLYVTVMTVATVSAHRRLALKTASR